ncbi:MAG: DUF1848 domain-containing protein [Lachnospiraceae bacterium]|nr:DUF1848 domain-containing protein [Lachnospiraceae bacterium]
MIINTGQRTDIPGFYSEWFMNRLKEGYVLVRNPFNENQVNRYILDPSVVDVIGFCTKNPAPMLPYMDRLVDFGQFWYVTITPYGRDIEQNVPGKAEVIRAFQSLSEIVGIDAIGWRYDPILLYGRYTEEFHLQAFRRFAGELSGYTKLCVISFIDFYTKVQKNFPELTMVSGEAMEYLGREIIKIAGEYGMEVRPCGEGGFLKKYGANCEGCMTKAVYERAIHQRLNLPASVKSPRKECVCYLSCDIGAYNTCMHLCRYCYANLDPALVKENYKQHDPKSPFLIGREKEGDVIHDAAQSSFIERQMSLFDM